MGRLIGFTDRDDVVVLEDREISKIMQGRTLRCCGLNLVVFKKLSGNIEDSCGRQGDPRLRISEVLGQGVSQDLCKFAMERP
jgi:hypothetical protein